MKTYLVMVEWRMWQYVFFRRLRDEVRYLLPGEVNSVVLGARRRTSESFELHRSEAPDPQGIVSVIGIPSMVLGTYRELVARGVSTEEAFDAVRRSFRKTFGASVRILARLLLSLGRRPVEATGKHLIPMYKAIFGNGFQFDHETTETGWKLVMPRCGAFNFLEAAGEPGLTRAVCEWDRNYLNVMDQSRKPIKTARTVTMSTGSERCEFVFDRSRERTVIPVDVVLRRPTGGRSSGAEGSGNMG